MHFSIFRCDWETGTAHHTAYRGAPVSKRLISPFVSVSTPHSPTPPPSRFPNSLHGTGEPATHEAIGAAGGEMAAATTMTWHEEMATLVDTGVSLPGSGVDAAPPTANVAAVGAGWFGDEEGVKAEEGWAQQARGFAESTAEMLVELGRGLWDVGVQSLASAEDTELARRLRRQAEATGKRLSFMNEYLPEERDPVRCWVVVAAVAFVTLLGNRRSRIRRSSLPQHPPCSHVSAST
jgi:hypothetical protein